MRLRSWSLGLGSPLVQAFVAPKVWLWLGFLTLILYVNVLQNGFVWDDRTMIFPSSSTATSMTSGKNIAQGNRLLQRPLMNVTFQMDRLLHSRNPAGFHLTNLLIHLVVTLVFAVMARNLLVSEFSALLATGLFVLHPVHSETVSALLGRSDLLVGLFSLIGLWAYRKRSLWALGLLFFLLAIASKESGLAVLGLFIWYDLCFRRREGRRLWIRWLTLLALVLLSIPVYLSLLHHNPWLAVSAPKWWGGTPYHAFLMMLTVLWEYARLLIFPSWLSPWYVTPAVTTILHWKVMAGLIVFLGALLLLVWSFRKQPMLSFGLGWILSALLPVSNIIPIPGSMMAERWLYVPSMGFCLLGGMALNWLWTKVLSPQRAVVKIGSVTVGLIFALLMGWQTIQSNTVWRNDETLFRRVVARFPNSFKGHSNLGKTLLDQRRVTEAKSELRKAILLKTDSPFPFLWLGEAFLREGKGDSALTSFCEAIRLDSTFYPAYLDLGGIYRRMGMADSALAVYRAGLRHTPNAELYNNLGVLLVEQNSLSDGIKAYEQAVKIDPGYGPAYHNLGNACRAQGDFARAEKAYRQALQADSSLAESHHALGLLYLFQGRNQEAVREFEQAVKKRPGELGFEISLARVYVMAGNPGRALETYDRILSLNPSLENLRSERDSLKKRLSDEP